MFCANFTKDEEFVEKFKKEHNEQFYVLVKMHLSFLLDMTTEESECFYEKVKQKRWNLVPFGKKSRNKTLQEGATLSPDVLTKIHPLIDFLKVDNRVQSDGIFRRTGSIERQHELKNALLHGSNVKFDGFTVHDCASVLKGFLADLPEPLTTDIQFPLYCQIAEMFNMDNTNHQSKILQTMQLLFLLLPKPNKSLLKAIFELLHLVAMNESSNRMSPDNLAKVFTPHLLCPRKLSPENLLKDSQSLFGVVAFMINKYTDLCKIPASLMLDFKSHYEQGAVLNESVKGAAHTVFTFVDNKLTAKENEENVTDAALAELYAHIQSLPESSKKRKLVKQFNKQNGHGTPLQVIRSTAPKTNKSFGDSIKKHMFHKKILKNAKMHAKNSSGDDLLDSPSLQQKTPSRGRLFCHNFDTSSEDEETVPKKLKSSEGTALPRTRRKSDSEFSLGEAIPSQYLTSTPACIINRTEEVFTPEGQGRKSMSPITRSAQRMSRAMQETMMTPRSRKPVLLVSGTNINNLAKLTPALTHLQEEDSESCIVEPSNTSVRTPKQQFLMKSKSEGELRSAQSGSNKINKTDSPKTLSDTFKQYLSSRDILTSDSMTDSTFSSRSDDFQSCSRTGLELEKSEAQEGNFSDSMMFVLDGNVPENGDDESMSDSEGEKKFVLKPRQFDENGKPIVFETSF